MSFAIFIPKYLFHIQAIVNEEMFAVVPLKSCPHLSELRPESAPIGKRLKKSNKNYGFTNAEFLFFQRLIPRPHVQTVNRLQRIGFV